MTSTSDKPPESVGPSFDEEAEAIVIGSGFGGAVAACRLAQAGVKVLLIERGRRYEKDDFPTLPDNASLLPDLTRWTWQQSQGLWDIIDLEEIVSVQAAGYGGGSLIYANVHLRPPPSVFDERWPEDYRGGGDLRDYYNLAAYMLDVAPIDAHPGLAGKVIKADQLRRVARHLGREDAFFTPPLAISSKDGPNVHGQEQKACTGCGACCTGCPETAKNTLDFNYLAIAEKHGAQVVTQCEVLDLAQADEGGWTLDCLDHLTARKRSYRAKNVFLCAGVVHSTRLLARLDRQTQKPDSLAGIGYFANADALGMVYGATHPQHPSFGPAITTSTICWENQEPGGFFMVQDGGYARQLERLLGVLQAPAWVGRNRLTRQSAATVGASVIAAPAALIEPARGLRLRSPVDDVLGAIADGTFKHVPSEALRRDVGTFLEELKDVLLLPLIVDRTIEISLQAWRRRSWLTRWLAPNGWIVRALRWLAHRTFGSSEVLAGRAFAEILSAADLPASDVARRVLGYGAAKAEHRVMLLAMGRDATPGHLVYDHRRERLVADLDLYHLTPRYTDEERVMSDMAGALGGELRTNPAWAFLGKPVTVHSQGGCPMADDPSLGVTTPEGQVHGRQGLFVLDGSILCTSVGVNPSATITAIAERNILRFIRRYRKNDLWPANAPGSAGAEEYQRQANAAEAWEKRAAEKHWPLSPPVAPSVPAQSAPLGLGFREVMQGYYLPTDQTPTDEAGYRKLETDGRPEFPMKLTLDVSADNLATFFEDCRHQMRLSGSVSIRLPGEAVERSYPTEGRLELFVPRYKPYGIHPSQIVRLAAQTALSGSYTTRVGAPPHGLQRTMNYFLSFTDDQGRAWALEGYKLIRDDPGMDAWRDTSALFISLLGPPSNGKATGASAAAGPVPRGAGVVHVDLDGFLFQQLPSLRITPLDTDRARAVWATLKFAAFFFGTLQRIYAPEIKAAVEALFKPHTNNVQQHQSRAVQ